MATIIQQSVFITVQTNMHAHACTYPRTGRVVRTEQCRFLVRSKAEIFLIATFVLHLSKFKVIATLYTLYINIYLFFYGELSKTKSLSNNKKYKHCPSAACR